MPDFVSIPPVSGRPWSRRRASSPPRRRDLRHRPSRVPVQLEFPFPEPNRPRDAAAYFVATAAGRDLSLRWADAEAG